MTLQETIERLTALRGRRVVILGHVNPDGDTVGSAAALGVMLRALGADCRLLFPSPLSERLRTLVQIGGLPVFIHDPAQPELGALREDETALAVDVASPGQLGALSPLAGRVAFMIDHHGTGTPFAPCLLQPEAAAAGEIVWRLYTALRADARPGPSLPELPDVARLLWAAVASDTGSFQFSNTSPAAMAAGGEMLALMRQDPHGPDAAELARLLFATVSFGALRANGLAALRVQTFAGGRLAATVITADDMARLGLTEADLSGAVDAPRSLAGTQIALCLKQLPDRPDVFRVSARSNGEADVAAPAAGFGGGGHTKAAGCSITAASPEEALRIAVEAFSAALPGGAR